MNNIELKPCPFCGGKAVVHVNNGVFVICTKCECRTMSLIDGKAQGRYTDGAIERVVEKWNNRTSSTNEQSE